MDQHTLAVTTIVTTLRWMERERRIALPFHALPMEFINYAYLAAMRINERTA